MGSMIALVLAAAVAFIPTPARAQHGGFHGGSVRAGNVMVPGFVGVPPFAFPVPVPRPAFRGPGDRPLVPFGSGFPAVVYAPPPAYYDAPTYYDPSGGGPMVGEPASLSAPGVIQYSTGRYELRGDGITTAYVWVWVPNPPSAPPDEATQTDPTDGMRRRSSSSSLPEPKIISIPAADASPASTDPTEPKIISIPRPVVPTATKR